MHLGADLGSISVNLVLLDDDYRVVEDHYIRHKGQPVKALAEGIDGVLSRRPGDQVESLTVTGSGGKLASEISGVAFVNEIVAQTAAVGRLYPNVHTVVEIGGQDSKLIILGEDEKTGRTVICDFAMNTICAAGTGSFLDQQASRLDLTVEEFGDLALRSEHPPRIAGRCSVFAKSDMIHLQQEGAPDYDIVAGLCFAMARNFKATIAKGKDFRLDYCFMGGVAANKGMVRAFTEVLGLDAGELVIPEHFASMGAIGAVLAAAEREELSPFAGTKAFYEYLSSEHEEEEGQERLVLRDVHLEAKADVVPPPKEGKQINCFLGVDVGSLSTNVVAMDENCNIISKRYLMTAGRPIEAIRRGLAEVGAEVADKVIVRGVGTTGSGRYLTGDFVGADVVKNEITAQATAAAYIDAGVDTVFEIGGQDSKYISLDNGAIVDFEMNKVCAAGTGSFIEEQSERLDVNIKKEFAELALSSEAPCRLGERCTVFMETDILSHQQKGAPREDLCAGLGYSIVLNYLNRVVQEKRVADNIFFQGGVAYNNAVVAAFEKVTGKPVTVPDHHEVTGAWGMAMIARELWDGESESKFKGWDLATRKYEQSSFECQDCSNHCEIKVVTVEGEEPLYYGSRCEKYDVERKKAHKRGEGLPNLFAEREKLLSRDYTSAKPAPGAPRVGLPRMLFIHEMLPFFKTFLAELGFEVVLSGYTNKNIIHDGVEAVASECCFPVKVAHGHVIDLLKKGVDAVFMPSAISLEKQNALTDKSFTCPYVQTSPYVISAALDLEAKEMPVLVPKLFFERGDAALVSALHEAVKPLGVKKGDVRRAYKAAKSAQNEFYARTKMRGIEVLESLGRDENAVVIVGRPYNTCDSGINLEMPKKFRDLGTLAIPMDFLPLEEVELSHEWDNMYWKYGQRILSAVEIVRKDPRLHGVYITNFGCGPDSFLLKFFWVKMGGKPFLQLEIDEHSADAGAITRAEAFLDSIKNFRDKVPASVEIKRLSLAAEDHKRTIYIPYMCDHAYAVRAAFEAVGVPAVVMDEPDDETLEWGRKFTTGKECYPCIVTTGDMVKYVKRPDFDPERAIFFMPAGSGPCRFGQYNMLHRAVLAELGLGDIPVFSPNQGKTLYNDLGIVGNEFTRRSWQGIVAVDMLEKLLLQTRPYELEPGAAHRVYWKYVKKIEESILKDGTLDAILAICREAVAEWPSIAVTDEAKPKIGVVGEIYVRSNRFSNSHFIDQVEELGGEVYVPTISEWFWYTNWTRIRDCKVRGDYSRLALSYVTQKIQKSDYAKITSIFEGLVGNWPEPEINETIGAGSRYVDDTFEGEAILSVGKAAEYGEHGLHGVANLMPFTCMPGVIVSALLKRVQAEHENIPILNMAYDGLESATTRTRIEAFIHQARQRLEVALAARK
jgi:predicted CoA-substrate-specific enzyme activase